MWLITTSGIYSVVAHMGKRDRFLIRSRWRRDLDRLKLEAGLPRPVITKTPLADYRYRMEVTRHELDKMMKEQLESITYGNFKNAAAERGCGDRRHDLLMELWSVIHRAANEEEHPEAAHLPGGIATEGWIEEARRELLKDYPRTTTRR
jgi:hypothetical protein